MSIRKLLAYAAIYILWGGSFLAIREIVAVVPPFFAAGFRFTLAGLLLVLYSYLRGECICSWRQWLGAGALGFIMFTCMYAGLFWAEIQVPSGIAAVISAMIPVWIFVGELTILRSQKASVLSLIGVILGFAGVAMLALPSSHSSTHISTTALLILIAATLCWAGGTLWSRSLSLPKPQTLNAGWQMAVGGGLIFVLSAMTGERGSMPPTNVLLRPLILGSMAYLVVAASIIAFTAYVWLIANEPTTRVASYAYVNPVIALFAGAVLAGERLAPFQLMGVFLVVAGVFSTLMGKQAVPVTKKVTV